MTGADAAPRLAMIAVSELSGELNFDRRCVSRLGTDELAMPGSYACSPSTVGSACEGEGRAAMSEQPTDRTAGTEEEATKPEGRDERYGHLTVEDDPEGTTDEAELSAGTRPGTRRSHDRTGRVNAERGPFGM